MSLHPARTGGEFFLANAYCHFYLEPKFPSLATSLWGRGAAMQVFWAEEIVTLEDQSTRVCRLCEEKMTLVRAIVDSDTAALIYMFECPCGERIWID